MERVLWIVHENIKKFPVLGSLIPLSGDFFAVFPTSGRTFLSVLRPDLSQFSILRSKKCAFCSVLRNTIYRPPPSPPQMWHGFILVQLRMGKLFIINATLLIEQLVLKKRLIWHRCFPVNFAKFLRAPIFMEPLRSLLL